MGYCCRIGVTRSDWQKKGGAPRGPPRGPPGSWREKQEAHISSSNEGFQMAAEVKAAAAASRAHISLLCCYVAPSPIIGLLSLGAPCSYLPHQENEHHKEQHPEKEEQQSACLGIVLEDGRLQILSLLGLRLTLEIKPLNRAVLHAATDRDSRYEPPNQLFTGPPRRPIPPPPVLGPGGTGAPSLGAPMHGSSYKP